MRRGRTPRRSPRPWQHAHAGAPRKPARHRHRALDPAGRHLLAANQDGDAIAVFRLGGDGALGPQVGAFAIGTPLCIAVLGPA
jgi:6-phosphogluconolactonase